jgi:membrane-bound serine protease (ClpP class)
MLIDYSVFAGPGIVFGIVLGCLAVVSIIAVARSHGRKPVAGRETLLGQTAVVQTPLDPEGMVLVEGELWRARARKTRIEVGAKVTVVTIDGLTLRVKEKEVTDD